MTSSTKPEVHNLWRQRLQWRTKPQPYHALMKFGKFKRMPFIIQCTSEVQRLQSSHQWLAECDIKPGAKSAIAELPCFADFFALI